ncbi:MAG: hypothetical protein J2P50_03680 [Hyphomicrobiaceae bacterium]|nr:hypothetical protein [Hyphomicrobiaceae bacterium]
MRYLLVLVLGVGIAGTAHGQASCNAAASEKKLAGAALASFMKKCESDAAKACDLSAQGKKLSGAAKTSYTGKCVRDKVGK